MEGACTSLTWCRGVSYLVRTAGTSGRRVGLGPRTRRTPPAPNQCPDVGQSGSQQLNEGGNGQFHSRVLTCWRQQKEDTDIRHTAGTLQQSGCPRSRPCTARSGLPPCCAGSSARTRQAMGSALTAGNSGSHREFPTRYLDALVLPLS